MNAGFAIWPDGGDRPTAFFTDLEDATEWALAKYGGDRFSIKWHVWDTIDRDAQRWS
jgi:hypothetical protein